MALRVNGFGLGAGFDCAIEVLFGLIIVIIIVIIIAILTTKP